MSSTDFIKTAAPLVLFAAVIFGQQEAAFDVASIKPTVPGPDGRAAKGGRGIADPSLFTVRNSPLTRLIRMAYDLADYQFSGGPAWISDDRWDVDARPPAPSSPEQMKLMLRNLLATRFQLVVHHETKPLAMNVLTVAKGGPKLGPQFHPAKEGAPAGPSNQLAFPAIPLKDFAFLLHENMGMFNPATGAVVPREDMPPVLDQTGLTGEYDIVLRLDTREDWPSLLEHQLGLKLELRKVPTDMMTIDSVAKPSGN